MNVKTFTAILGRDFKVLQKQFLMFFIRTCIQPLLLLFAFGYLIPLMGVGINKEYSHVLIPGIITSTMLMVGMQSVAFELSLDFQYFKEIEDRLLAPIKPVWIAVEKLFMGMIQAIFSGMLIIPYSYLLLGTGISFLEVNIPIFILLSTLSALTFTSFGLLMGSTLNVNQTSIVVSILVAPMMFLGAVYFPWERLSVIPWLKWTLLINPVIYSSEGIRYSITPQLETMPLWGIFTGLIISISILLYFGLKKFNEKSIL